MAGKTEWVAAGMLMVTVLAIPGAISGGIQVPPNKAQVNGWFQQNVRPLASRKGTVDPALAAAEGRARTVRVRKDGTGDFRTVAEAVGSVPAGNADRVVVWIGGGNYSEKIKIERSKPFVTFYGAPNDVPTLVFGGTAAQYGTVDSATLIVESDYFTAVNLVIANSAPRPDGKRKGAQAAALRISGDKAAFYNSRFLGFQDTICDDMGRHFFKDCYVEGTVDFVFGSGKSLYLNTELHVIPGDAMAMITAQARGSDAEDSGYSFVHCKVTGTGRNAFLGRAWKPYARVVYAYTDMSDVVHPQGWFDNYNAANDKTVYNAEYKCMGPGSNFRERVGFAKQLGDAEASRFISLAYLESSKWLLPPHST